MKILRLFLALAILGANFSLPVAAQTPQQRQLQQQRYQQQQLQQQQYQRQQQLQARRQRLQQLQTRQRQLQQQQQQLRYKQQQLQQQRQTAARKTTADANANKKLAAGRTNAVRRKTTPNNGQQAQAGTRVGRSRALAVPKSTNLVSGSGPKTPIPAVRSPQVLQAKASLRTNQLSALRASLQTKLQARQALSSGGDGARRPPSGAVAGAGPGKLPSPTNGKGETAYHYTFNQTVESIKKEGLRPGSFATPTGTLSPLQAQIDLALTPTGLRNAVLKIDVDGLRRAGYKIPAVTPVVRSNNMPGGGYEMKFDYAIPPQFITIVDK